MGQSRAPGAQKSEAKLLFYPDPRLRRRADPVEGIDERALERVDRMVEIMRERQGVGLASTQIGWNARVFVARDLENPDRETVYVNPEIIRVSDEEVTEEEGCLSIPGVRAPVARHRSIVLRALDLQMNPFEEEASDFRARAFQHEIDHLDGILFVSRLGVGARMTADRLLKRMEREFRKAGSRDTHR